MKRVTGGWRRLHNEELQKLYSSLNIIRVGKMKMCTKFGPKTGREGKGREGKGREGKGREGNIIRVGKMKNAHKI
jgi:hypothetical protein